MMLRATVTNHRAGTTRTRTASGHGRLSSGKMNPDSSMVGSIVPTIAPNIATRCDDVRAEMRMPSDSDTRMNSSPSARSSVRLPRSGTSKTRRASTMTQMTDTKPMTRYGATLPTTICHGRSGDTSSVSSVPVSFSRVSEIAVISEEMIVSTNAISPGTNRLELSRVGLNRVRTCGTIRTDARRRPDLALVALDHLQRVGLHGAPGVRLRRVGDDLHARRKALPQPPANPGSKTIASCASPR